MIFVPTEDAHVTSY